MKTRDTEYLYATMRIRSLERTLLDEERVERMIEAKSFDEVTKSLSELGYTGIQNGTQAEVEASIANARRETFNLLTGFLKNTALVDVFRIKYDYHNVKAIIKSDAVGIDCTRLLIDSGRIPSSELRAIMRQMEYKSLGEIMGAAVIDARDTLARTNDPQLADFILDRAYFREMQLAAKESNSRFFHEYVSLMIDISNLRALVRASRQKKDAEFLRGALSDGGNIPTVKFVDSLCAEIPLAELFTSTPLETAAIEGARAIAGEAGFTAFERLCDNALIEYIRKARYIAFGEAPLVAYLAAKEADITAIRIIMAGKLQELPNEEIRERVRLSYV